MKNSKLNKKRDFYKEILNVLQELKSSYPEYTIGMHLSTALDEYNDIWGVPDSEVLYALEKYRATLEYTNAPRETSGEDLEKIINDGMNLSTSSLLETEDNG